MIDSPPAADYYAVLQVHPGADRDTVEAAYRQLMKKYHPDVAGMDSGLAADYHGRAKIINQAHSVLRDPAQRRRYDLLRNNDRSPVATPSPPRPAERNHAPADRGANEPPPSPQEESARSKDDESMVGVVLRSPFAALAAAYYWLPGPFEWEHGHRQEVLTTCLLPPVGIAAFALATGRLAPWVGASLLQTLLAWGILVVLLLPSWSSVPRLALASGPSLLLLTGIVDSTLHQASAPAWLAWAGLGCLSLALSARLYLFAVLPTVAVCWLMVRPG